MTKLDADHGLERLKRLATAAAREALSRDEPEFVEAFRAALLRLQNRELAVAETAPMIAGRFQKWPAALTALFDVELGMNKLRETVKFLERTLPDGPFAIEAWYHVEFFVFRLDALLDRCETALKKCTRLMLKKDDRPASIAEIEADIAALKGFSSKYRDPLAHGAGGGVDGITEHWVTFLALLDDGATLEAFNATIIDGVSEARDRTTRESWCNQLRAGAVSVYADIDALCGRLADEIEKRR